MDKQSATADDSSLAIKIQQKCFTCYMLSRTPYYFTMAEPDPIQLPIDGVLDLHTFRPSEVKDLVPDYLDACRERGILHVRIIHGKGIGNLRRTIHALLARHSHVVEFGLDHPQFGDWGATIVTLKPKDP